MVEGELLLLRLRRQIGPPGRQGSPFDRTQGLSLVVEEDFAEHAVIGKDEGEVWEPEDEMVVFGGNKLGRGRQETAGHTEMEAQKTVPGKLEAELLAVGGGGHEPAPGQFTFHEGSGSLAENPGLRVGADTLDDVTETGIPLLSEKRNFG